MISGDIMENNDKYKILYDISNNIINLYDNLFLMKKDRNFDNSKILMKIKKKIEEEYNLYSKLDIDDINALMNIIENNDENKLDFSNIRIKMKLAIIYDKLCGYNISNFDLIDDEINYSLIDLTTSKIIIDIYKLLNYKLSNVSVSDDKSIQYIKDMKRLNSQYIIYKLSLYDVSERLGLEYNFNINNIPVISFDDIEKNIYEIYNINMDIEKDMNTQILVFVLSKINMFSSLKMDINDYGSIYDNLLYVSILEVLFSYLNKQQLEFFKAYFSRIKSDNKIVANNVKRLIKNKLNEL